MSALQDKDSDAQVTSNTEQTMATGSENKAEEVGQHKQLLNHKNG